MTSAVLSSSSSSSSSIMPSLAAFSVASLLAGLVVILGRIPLEYELKQQNSVRERQNVRSNSVFVVCVCVCECVYRV